jgi:hypothetical protein
MTSRRDCPAVRAPYLRDVFIAIGVLSETFDTAWGASTAPNPEC